MPEFVLTAVPAPRQVFWELGKRVHLAEAIGDDSRTLCGLKGRVRPASAGPACSKCRMVADSHARVERLMKTG